MDGSRVVIAGLCMAGNGGWVDCSGDLESRTGWACRKSMSSPQNHSSEGTVFFTRLVLVENMLTGLTRAYFDS